MTQAFRVLDIIRLERHDSDLEKLYQRLQSLKRDYFAPNEKIVIEHYDSEFFYHNHLLGFTTHNVMTMISRLGISLNVFVFITTYHRFREAIQPFIVDAADQPTVIVPLVSRMYRPQFDFDNTTYIGNNKDIRYHTMCLLGRPSAHKRWLAKYLVANNMLDRVEVNYNLFRLQRGVPRHIVSLDANPNISPLPLGLVYSQPHRVNESWDCPLRNPLLVQLDAVELPNQIRSYILSPEVDPDQDPFDNGFGFYRNFGMNVVCETAVDNPHSWPISEKTLRSIYTETPFIVLGAAGLLKTLRSFGFDTFHDYWDETYDDILDPQDRFAAFCRTLHSIYQLSLHDLQALNQELSPRLARNRARLEHYLDNDYKNIYNTYSIDHDQDQPFDS